MTYREMLEKMEQRREESLEWFKRHRKEIPEGLFREIYAAAWRDSYVTLGVLLEVNK